ncbi:MULTISPECIES: methyl-accepting chemotaxis protein [unclassified Haematospirillum]|uniref:methyl-accepting chemotaxis protein n=1 Tax=unclassified Haematospirillum TaxID=2622088 RepID=UPI001438D59A|nr:MULTISPECIES: methyl-accepting chemotaxis protein [unclassified Haematospirillum]NKD55499.1 chemotaxis protein [Haematospirillum sp. H4890]NKD75639.1 chemotaxis protein [Haematospirillum sp. H4485]
MTSLSSHKGTLGTEAWVTERGLQDAARVVPAVSDAVLAHISSDAVDGSSGVSSFRARWDGLLSVGVTEYPEPHLPQDPVYRLATSMFLSMASSALARQFRFRTSRCDAAIRSLHGRVVPDLMETSGSESVQAIPSAAKDAHSILILRQMADTAADVNDAAVVLASLSRNSHITSSSGEAISSAATELLASVEEIARNSGTASGEASAADALVREGVSDVERARNAIRDIAGAVEQTALSVSDLSTASEQIGEILVVIEAIASQTNLLALNATIEAARAGEMGKGFAVVANEVKTLANQTARATEDITRRIDALRVGMTTIRETMARSTRAVDMGRSAIESIQEKMHAVSSQVTEAARQMQEINTILGQQKEATGEIARSITAVAEMSRDNVSLVTKVADSIHSSNDAVSKSAKEWFVEGSAQGLCEMARVDHILFKKRVVDVLMGNGEWQPTDVPDHHSCRLGRWYDALNDQRIKALPEYAALEGPHATVHAEARKALQAWYSGERDNALVHLDELHEASRAVISLLNALSRKLD